MNRHPAIPYVLPFAVFIGFLAVERFVPVPQAARFVVSVAVLYFFSRGVLTFRASKPGASIVVGTAVFLIWVGPELMFRGYHDHWLFSNPLLGKAATSVLDPQKTNMTFLIFRVLGSVITIPLLEELFWRGWLMRWLINRDFERVPPGAYHPEAFWITAAMFAMEHGSFWDVGLAAGVIYNAWMVRTKNLADCMLAHSVTNAFLALFVINRGEWRYWI